MTSLRDHFPISVVEKTVLSKHDKNDITEWCREFNITATCLGMYRFKYVWFIDNDEDRIMFKMRWL